MDQPLFNPAPVRLHRRRKQIATAAPVAPLTLVAATYEPASSVTLRFDRAIDIAAFETAAVVVEDGEFAFARFVGDGAAELADPVTVVVLLAMGEGEGSPGVRLNVAADNGIVASDGGVFHGVSDVALPFGEA